MRLRLAVLLVVLGALAAVPAAAQAAFTARGSVEQVSVTGAKAGEKLVLLDAGGSEVASRTVNELGGALFRDVKPGEGYRVRGSSTSEPLTVLTKASAPPSTKVYEQRLPSSGYGYMTMRDGTKLAYYVHPPQDVQNVLPEGQRPPNVPLPGATPTLIEYSGYGYANPAGPQSGIAILANLMGFTVVDVNMRGTGCSGGAFDFFEPLQSLDGYDIVETVSRQPWVAHGKVGMMGISYGGISQLFTAQTRPPSLAAITPLSVIDATHTTLYPGGIINTGFALNWAKERIKEALPASEKGGQPWAHKRIQEGDEVCKENQALHPEAADLMKKVRENDHYVPEVADPLAPATFVDKIDVPTFVVCQWQDEQTGGHCPNLADRFTGTAKKWFTFHNGTHVDSLAPEAFNRWYDFLQLYVARKHPRDNAAPYRAGAPLIYSAAMGIEGVEMPPDPIQDEPTYEAALAAFERQPAVRVLFENGAGGTAPGQPLPAFERSFPSFPVPGTRARSWYLSAGGTLAERPPARQRIDAFKWDPKARPLTNFTGDTAAGAGGLWTATPPYKWQDPPAGSAASYVTAPLNEDNTVLGAGSVKLWVRSSKPNVDLQATISEVRQDGKEVFVQGGWLRAKVRKLAKGSTSLRPVLTLRKRDRRGMPRKRFVGLTIPLYYQGHAYRKGSRVRVTITAPNGDQPVWSFGEPSPPKGTATVAIAASRKRPSRLTLPVVPGVEVPAALPPCPGLRAQPCREYAAYANRSVRR